MTDYGYTSSFLDFDDADYVRRTLAGERQSFEVLVRQYAGMVHAIAMARLGHDPDSADELTQEVFLRAWLQMDKLSRPEAFPAWLAQITRNLAVDWTRRELRISGLVQMVSTDDQEAMAVPLEEPTPYQAAARDEEAKQIWEALGKLAPLERELLLLHHAEGVSQAEIARRLGVNPSTVMRKLDKAARRLRALFHDEPSLVLRSGNHDKLMRRTTALLAAAWALSAAQRTSLAHVAAQSLPIPQPVSSQLFILTTRGGQLMSAAAVIAILVAWSISGNFPNDGIGSAVREAGNVWSNGGEVQIRTIDDSAVRRKLASGKGIVSESSRSPENGLRRAGITNRTTATAASMNSARETTTSKAPDNMADVEKWPGRVTGQVVDVSGGPIEEVTVRVAAYTNATPHPGHPQKQHPNHAIGVLSQPVLHTGTKGTDKAGNFTFEFSTTGTAALYTDHEPYVRTLQKVVLPTENLRIELKTEGGATAEGRVLDLASGEPVANADVVISMNEHADFWSGDQMGTQTLTLLGGYERLQTDGNGRYSIDRMPAVEVSLMGWSDQIGPSVPGKLLMTEDPVLVAGKTTTLPDIYVFTGYTLRGYVRDWHTSQPVVGATVGPGPNMGYLVGSSLMTAVTDENGYYEITGMRPIVGKPRGGEPSRISFSPVYAKKEGYRQAMHMPQVSGEFDPNNLVVEHDFRINPQKEGETGMPRG